MANRFDWSGTANDDARQIEFDSDSREREELLRCDDRLSRRRNSNPIVLDAQPRRIAVFDMLLRALDRGHEHQRNGDRENGEAGRFEHPIDNVLYHVSAR